MLVAKGKRTVLGEGPSRERIRKDMSEAKKSQKKRIPTSRRRKGQSVELEVIDSFESWLDRQPVRAVKAKAGYNAAEQQAEEDDTDERRKERG